MRWCLRWLAWVLGSRFHNYVRAETAEEALRIFKSEHATEEFTRIEVIFEYPGWFRVDWQTPDLW